MIATETITSTKPAKSGRVPSRRKAVATPPPPPAAPVRKRVFPLFGKDSIEILDMKSVFK